jgi:hypothetical protein
MKHLLTFPLALLLLSACTTAHIDLPSGAMTVEGSNPRIWNRPIAFGPYRTAWVDEGTRRSWLADLNLVSFGRADQAYHLALGDTAIDCHTREFVIGRNGFNFDPTLGRSPLLVCGFDEAGARTTLLLSKTGRAEPSLRGEIRSVGADGPPLTVSSIHRAAGSVIGSPEPFGYEIRSGERVVGIVETVNRGRVWIDPELDRAEQDKLAAAAAALLLFRDPDAGE